MSADVRTVRDDQHGTMTGYAYGCRCEDCRAARRRLGNEGGSVGADTLDRVYKALEHEADMDGIVTASGERLGELAGASRASAWAAVHALAESGRVTIVGRAEGRGGILEVHLAEVAS